MSTNSMSKNASQTTTKRITLVALGLCFVLFILSAYAFWQQNQANWSSPSPNFQLAAKVDLAARSYDGAPVAQLSLAKTAVVNISYTLPNIDIAYFDLSLNGSNDDNFTILHSEDYHTDENGGGIWEQSLSPGVYQLKLTAPQTSGTLSVFWKYEQMLSRAIDSDPQKVATISSNIADYRLPIGFGDEQAVQWANFSMVMHTAVDSRTHITLMQAPAALSFDRAALERKMSIASGADQWHEVRVIETQPCQIRDQASTLVISQGVSHDGNTYRSASAVFEGNGGTALVNVSGPTANWDQTMVDSFIKSLH